MIGALKRSQPEVLILAGLPVLAAGIWGAARQRLNAAEAWAVSLYASAQAIFVVTLLGLLQQILGLSFPMWISSGIAALAWCWTVSGAARPGAARRVLYPLWALLLALWLFCALFLSFAALVVMSLGA
ncbi:hypothetical protein [Pseudomarimonas arenosa]|uniref:Uncharacterized protein n=1 Tax=Pseudomarimonas arenosa TaxID=2774145 RepID=A0AAW3ZPC1_9GAMM|nr:hypothetical protein [Pseudomarimonas arenosa]MBD8527803.1 hypothetical protein [Pseudomarimonas arenosa]